MRLTPTLVLMAGFALAGCGDDEPEPAQTRAPVQRPAPQRPAVDTAASDTTPAAGQPARPGQTPDQAQGRGDPTSEDRGGEAGRAGAEQGAADRAAAAGAPLYTVQVAAFTEPESAREWTGRLQRQNLPVWTSMAELGGRTFYRVRVGAVPTVSEARRLGALITERFEWPVWVAPITPSDPVPDGAVPATRRVLGG